MIRFFKRLLSVTREMIREQAKVMEESNRTERELDRSLRRASKSKASRRNPD
jgi:sugar diacid utilization regulator